MNYLQRHTLYTTLTLLIVCGSYPLINMVVVLKNSACIKHISAIGYDGTFIYCYDMSNNMQIEYKVNLNDIATIVADVD